MTSSYGINQDLNGYMKPNNSVYSSVERYNYEDGRRRKEALFDDINGDGISDLHAVSLFCYDDTTYKPTTDMVRLIDNDADGRADVIEYYESDDLGMHKYKVDTFDNLKKDESLMSKLGLTEEPNRDMQSAYDAYGLMIEYDD